MTSPTRREFLAASAVTLSAASRTTARPISPTRRSGSRSWACGRAAAPRTGLRGDSGRRDRVPRRSRSVDGQAGARRSCRPPPRSPTATDIRKVLDDKTITAVVVVGAGSLARARHHLGRGARQARLRREAGVAQPDRGPADGRGGAQVQGRRPGRHAAAQRMRRDRGPRVRPGREARQGRLRAGLDRRQPAEHRPRGSRKSPPKGVDYDLWLGPASERPFTKNRFHYNWHWFWDLGTGETRQQRHPRARRGPQHPGPRRPDRGSPAAAASTTTTTTNKRPTRRSRPSTSLRPRWRRPATLLWEHRVWEKKGPEDQSYGIAIHGDKGTMLFKGDGWEVRGGDGAKEAAGQEHRRRAPEELHRLDSRRRQAERRDRDRAHVSTRLCHLGNIAYRTGKMIHFDRDRPRRPTAPRRTSCSAASIARASSCRRFSENSSAESLHSGVGKPIAEAVGLAAIMRDVQDGDFAQIAEAREQFHERVAGVVVERTERFVEQEHRRMRCERPAERDTLLLAAAQELRPAIEQMRRLPASRPVPRRASRSPCADRPGLRARRRGSRARSWW